MSIQRALVLATGRERDATEPAQVTARAIVSIAAGDKHRDATLLALTADRLEVV